MLNLTPYQWLMLPTVSVFIGFLVFFNDYNSESDDSESESDSDGGDGGDGDDESKNKRVVLFVLPEVPESMFE